MDTEKFINDFLNSLNGQSLELSLKSEETKDADGKSWWRAVGELRTSATRDGKNWGEVGFESSAIDTDSTTAFSVVLSSFVNFISSPDFHYMLFSEVENAENNARGKLKDEQG